MLLTGAATFVLVAFVLPLGTIDSYNRICIF